MGRSALEIADHILSVYGFVASDISNMKLQKLLYYSQGYHLAINGNPLFDDPIEKWPYGPVVDAVYRKYKSFGGNPITSSEPASQLRIDELHSVHRACSAYGSIPALVLSDMTHRESPWLQTLDNAIIDNSLIRDYFRKLLQLPA